MSEPILLAFALDAVYASMERCPQELELPLSVLESGSGARDLPLCLGNREAVEPLDGEALHEALFRASLTQMAAERARRAEVRRFLFRPSVVAHAAHDAA
jgi:hypothetical protein